MHQLAIGGSPSSQSGLRICAHLPEGVRLLPVRLAVVQPPNVEVHPHALRRASRSKSEPAVEKAWHAGAGTAAGHQVQHGSRAPPVAAKPILLLQLWQTSDTRTQVTVPTWSSSFLQALYLPAGCGTACRRHPPAWRRRAPCTLGWWCGRVGTGAAPRASPPPHKESAGHHPAWAPARLGVAAAGRVFVLWGRENCPSAAMHRGGQEGNCSVAQ